MNVNITKFFNDIGYFINIIFTYFLAFLIIVYVLWRFFLRERIPHELTFPFSYSYLFIAILIILLHGYSIYIKFYTPKPPKNPILISLSKYAVKINNYIDAAYITIYSLLVLIPFIVRFGVKTGEYLIGFRVWFDYTQYIYILFNLFPRLIVALSFFIDVVFFNYMYYFYYAVYLLLFPLILRILIFFLEKLSEEYKKDVLEVLIIKEDLIEFLLDGRLLFNRTYIWKDPNIPQTEFFCVAYYKAYYKFAEQVLAALELMNTFDEFKKTKIIQVFIHLIYIFSWGYTLFKLLVNFLCFICLIGSIGF